MNYNRLKPISLTSILTLTKQLHGMAFVHTNHIVLSLLSTLLAKLHQGLLYVSELKAKYILPIAIQAV